LFILTYFIFKKSKLFFKALALGFIYFLIVALFNFIINILDFNLFTVLDILLLTAIPEVAAKYFICCLALNNKKAAINDKLLLVIILALTFSFAENTLHLNSSLDIIFIRLITVLPLHLLTSLILVSYKYGLIYAIFIHTVFDSLVYSSLNSFFIILFVVLVAIIVSRKLYRLLKPVKIDFFS